MVGTAVDGWLKKSHAGMPFHVDSRKRFFSSQGFHVYYCAQNPANSTVNPLALILTLTHR